MKPLLELPGSMESESGNIHLLGNKFKSDEYINRNSTIHSYRRTQIKDATSGVLSRQVHFLKKHQ